jgi:hypothetical protein
MRNVCAMIFLPFAIDMTCEMDAMSLDPVVVPRQGESPLARTYG